MRRSTRSRLSESLRIIGLGFFVLLSFASGASGQSCGEIGGTYCSQTLRCPSGFVSLGSTYDCNPCCQTAPPSGPSCGALGGDYCSQSAGCPSGYTSLGATYDCRTCCDLNLFDGAAVVSANLPTSLTYGATYTASVTVRNTGTTTWTSDVYRLGAVGDSDPFGPGRVLLPAGVSVPPNGLYTFVFTLTAPTAPGSYLTDWRMVHEGVRWFGGVASSTVQVTPGIDDAAVVSANLPTSLPCGATYTASVTVRNTGTSAWTSDVYRLGAVGDSDPLGPGRVLLPAGVSVPPGALYTFVFTVTAPAAASSYLTDWQMVHEGVRWFGGVASSTVEVSCPPEPPLLPLRTVGNRFYAGDQEVKLIGGVVCCGDYPANGWPFISGSYIERFRENSLKYVHIRTGPFIRGGEARIFEGYRWIPDEAAPDQGKYDLNQFEPAFTRHLRATLDATLAAGIYTEIDLVDAWPPRHRLSPFNAENNINGFDAGSSGCQMFRSTPHPFVEAWVRHIVRATANYPHVLYQVGNETSVCRSKPEYELGIYGIAKDEMRAMGVDRPVGTNSLYDGLDYRTYHGFFVPVPESIPVLVNETDNEFHAPEEYANFMVQGLVHGGVYFQGWRGPLDQSSFETLLGLIRNIMVGTP